MLYAIVAIIALILDQAVKYWTTANLVLNTGVKELIPGVIRLTNIHNTGAAFSILEGARWFFVILCIAFVALIIYVLAKDIINTPKARWMAVMVMAGAVGNCIDRIICGYVVDMFELELFTFPIFNVADIYITVCGILFCLFVLLEKPAGAGTGAGTGAETASKPAVKKVMPLRKREKVSIPDFPKREKPAVSQPEIDPNDPFAEWENRASKAASGKQDEEAASTAARLKAEAEEFLRSQTAAESSKAPKTAEVPVYRQPQPASAEKPAQPAAEPTAAELPKSVEDFDFDLDDILAEFKDI